MKMGWVVIEKIGLTWPSMLLLPGNVHPGDKGDDQVCGTDTAKHVRKDHSGIEQNSCHTENRCFGEGLAAGDERPQSLWVVG
jgi:hypothetical protein